jgi:hypothetical protein
MPGADAREARLTPAGIARAPDPLGIPNAYFATALGHRSLAALDKGTNFLDIGFEHAMFNCGSDR